MEGIQVSTQTVGSKNHLSVIKVGGYIDTTTSSEVERVLNSLLKQGRFQIIIDLGNVDYISSAGWGIFISEIKAIRENNGDLKLVRMIPDVYEIFELLEFHHILDVYDSVEEAVSKFEESQYVEMVSSDGFGGDTHNPQPEQPRMAPPQERPAGEPQQPAPQRPQQPAPGQQPAFREPVMAAEPVNTFDVAAMTTEDKIKFIVANNPELGAFKINKRLNSQDFGFTKVGWFGVRSWLNKLGLSSRKARRAFAARR